MTARVRLLLFVTAVIALSPQAALADCTGPSGVESQTIYDFTDHTLKVCTGTDWVSLGAGTALSVLTDVSVASVSSGQVLGWSGSAWVPFNVQIAPNMISASSGTNIGNMTSNGGLAAAFDGNTSQTDAQVALKTTNDGWVGKQYSSAEEVTAWKAWGSSDYGFCNASSNGATVIALQHKDSACSTDSGWTTVDSETITNNTQSIDRSFASAGAHLCWRLKLTSGCVAGGHTRTAELQLFKQGSATAQELWSAGGGNVYRSSGNVGIGTASPSDKLQIASTGNSVLRLDSGAGLGSVVKHYNGATAGSGIALFPASGAAAVALLKSDLTNSMAPLVVFQNGNVGIGTGVTVPSTPAAPARLHVTASGNQSGVWIESNTTSHAALIVGNSGVSGFGIYDSVSANHRLDGRVGIGIAPSTFYKFLVSSNIQSIRSETSGSSEAAVVGVNTVNGTWSALGYGSYGLYVQGPAHSTAGAWASSDSRLKENIRSIESPLKTVLALHPVSYTWKKNTDQALFNQGTEYGLIAQEVQKVLPGLVRELKAGPVMLEGKKKTLNQELVTFYGLQYDKFVPILIGAVQELKAANDNQAAAIEELRREIETLKAAR